MALSSQEKGSGFSRGFVVCALSLLALAACQAAATGTATATGAALGSTVGPGGAAVGAAVGYTAALLYFQEEELTERERMLVELAKGQSKGLYDDLVDLLKFIGLGVAVWYALEKFLSTKKGKKLKDEIRAEIDERFNGT